MSINEQPLVTVYIPTFNRLELLQRAVESVRNQTYKNLEIIVVDDCSTDGTQEYLMKLSKEDERVRYFLKEKNSGACVSRNIAIENAKGEFVTGLDDDDFFEKNRINMFLKAWFVKGKTTKILYSLYKRKTKDGVLLPLEGIKKYCIKKKIMHQDLLYFFYIGNQIFTETNLLKKNLFDKDMPAWQDFECYYRFLKTFKCFAELVPESSYVVDVSHPHERISTKKVGSILEAYQLFKNKHELKGYNLILLRCHLYNYPGIEINMRDIMIRIFYKPSILDLKRILGIKVI